MLESQGAVAWRDPRRLYAPPVKLLDPENQDYLLCIGHDTKTGYRIAFPISPSGHSRNCTWIKDFNLLQPLNLPDLANPLKRQGSFKCTNKTCQRFKNFISLENIYMTLFNQSV